MRLQLYKSLWGVVRRDGGSKSLSEALAPLRAQGYVGVECSVRLAYDLDTHENEGGVGFAGALAEHGLAWIPILFSSGPVDGWNPHLPGDQRVPHDGDVASHVRALREQVSQCQCQCQWGLSYSGGSLVMRQAEPGTPAETRPERLSRR